MIGQAETSGAGVHHLLIDTDAGIDDAMALFLALRSQELHIVGITSVFGNSTVEHTTLNAAAVLHCAQRTDIPLAVGASSAMATMLGPRPGIFHGSDGLANQGARLRPKSPTLERVPAAWFIHETVRKAPGAVTIAALGPLTNIALAIQMDRQIATKIGRIVALGGAVRVPGNATPAAEANFHDDPHAAAIVLASGIDVTLVGLDCTTDVVMDPGYIEAVFAHDTPESNFMRSIIGWYQDAYATYHGMQQSVICHDATLIMYLLHPEWFETELLPVNITTSGRNKGMLLVDHKRVWDDSEQVRVCTAVDAPRVLAAILEHFA